MVLQEFVFRGEVVDPVVDFDIYDQGTIVLFSPMSPAAKEWFQEHVAYESWQCLGSSVAVDHRPARDLLSILADEGFSLSFR